jgi:uncharacterized protein (TIRG00374 family)
MRSATDFILIGTFFNQVLPSAIGGDAMRAWLMHKQQIPLMQGVGSILLDRLAALISLSLIAMAGFTGWAGLFPHGGTVLLICVCLTVIFLLVMYYYRHHFRESSPRWSGALAHLQTMMGNLRPLMLKPIIIAEVFGISILIHAIVCMTFWLFAQAMGINSITFTQLFICSAIALITSVIPISAAGWGVREGTFAFLLGSLGVPVPEAVALSVGFGIASFFSGMPGMLLWSSRHSHRK